MKWRLQPIRVYCLHHICSEFDAETMVACDWTQIDEFKAKVLAMQKSGVVFISLSKAYAMIAKDIFRSDKYAVLTADDGYSSLKEILPWLEEHQIPMTLFVNGKYLDGKSYRHTPKEQYLTKEDIWTLTSPLIEIGSHGWEHIESTKMTLEEFKESDTKNASVLQEHPRYVPFYAYTYGKHRAEQDTYLRTIGHIPVLIDGEDNYSDTNFVHRTLFE